MPAVAKNITGPGYSICFINGSHNMSGGSSVRWFYHWNRVLKDDPFYVSPATGTPPAG
jgi:hypothetical protein